MNHNAMIDKKVFEILTGGILAIVDTTDGRKITGFASASEVIADYVESREDALIDELLEEVCELEADSTQSKPDGLKILFRKDDIIDLLKSKKK